MASLINKARKPKFEVHLTIYDLNNVPLVTGVSFIKWHLPHSISSEHRGRTPKCPIADHRVEYNYTKVIPVRVGIDKQNNLAECPIEFEILQEFNSSGPASAGGAAAVVGAGGTEKINLGTVRINLSEYVEESEALLRSSRRVSYTGSDLGRPLTAATTSTSGHSRKRSSLSLGGSSTAGGAESVLSKSVSSSHNDDTLRPHPSAATTLPDVEEGVIRRHLLQDSKINSTLKVGILMVQVDGERNFVAPPLKTAPVFGGIAGLMASGDAGGTIEPPADPASAGGGENNGNGAGGSVEPLGLGLAGKSRDLYEVQDMYRRALAASWACTPGEMAADELIEDIFSGGDGFLRSEKKTKNDVTPKSSKTGNTAGGGGNSGSPSRAGKAGNSPGKSPASSGSGEDDLTSTLRPHHLARLRHHFHRNSGEKGNNASTTSSNITTAFPALKGSSQAEGISVTETSGGGVSVHFRPRSGHKREESRDGGPRSRSESLGSLATTLGSSERGRDRDGFRKPREVREGEVREDMVAWSMGGVVT